jgi:hypothetical protein
LWDGGGYLANKLYLGISIHNPYFIDEKDEEKFAIFKKF